MSQRASLWIGFLAGGWAATLLLLVLPSLGLRLASANDPPVPAVPVPGPPPASGQNPQPGPTVNPLQAPFTPRGAAPASGGGTSDSNNHAIALSASIGGGESAVYYFDTRAQRLLVYQYKGIIQGSKPLDTRDKGGLRLLAARHMDYDLRLEGYRDLSENTRSQLQKAFGASLGSLGPKGPAGLPPQKVEVKGGLK